MALANRSNHDVPGRKAGKICSHQNVLINEVLAF